MATPIFAGKDTTQLLRYAEHIFLKMTENADLFPDPNPDLTMLESSITAYRDAYAEATFRDKRAVVLKGQKGKDLQEVIYRLSHYVDAVAQGDPGIILAAGYDVSQPTTKRTGRTPKAGNLRVNHVEVGKGIIQLKVKPWKPARLYRYEYRKKGAETWEGILYPNSTLELSDLDVLQEYEFRASYIGRDIEPNFSDIVTAIVV